MNFQLYLMYFPKMKINKELQFTQLSVLMTLPKLTLSDPKTKNLKQSCMRKANKNQYAKQPRANNEKFIKNLSHKKITDHEAASLAKGLKFIPTPPVPASNKSLLKDFQVLPAICTYNIYLLTQHARPTHSTLNTSTISGTGKLFGTHQI